MMQQRLQHEHFPQQQRGGWGLPSMLMPQLYSDTSSNVLPVGYNHHWHSWHQTACLPRPKGRLDSGTKGTGHAAKIKEME